MKGVVAILRWAKVVEFHRHALLTPTDTSRGRRELDTKDSQDEGTGYPGSRFEPPHAYAALQQFAPVAGASANLAEWGACGEGVEGGLVRNGMSKCVGDGRRDVPKEGKGNAAAGHQAIDSRVWWLLQ